MEIIKLNKIQEHILNSFKSNEYIKNMTVIHQKTRISFKEGRFNYFILFPRENGMTLHVNLRKYKDNSIFDGFQKRCFNNAKQYIEKHIKTTREAISIIELLKNK